MNQKVPFRRGSSSSRNLDPARRLLAAIAMQALKDALKPPKSLDEMDRVLARRFVAENEDLYLHLGIPVTKYKQVVAEVAQ